MNGAKGKRPLTQRERERMAWRGSLMGIAELTGETYATIAARAGVPPYLKDERCAAPVLDDEQRATVCGEQATEEREVATGAGAERVCLSFCGRHAAEIDAKDGAS